jgi:PAS domain S-box-containing protein
MKYHLHPISYSMHDRNYLPAILQDFCNKEKTERTMKESEKQYSDLIRHLPSAVYTCDADGRILICNPAAIALWGGEPQADQLWCGTWKMYDPDNTLIPREYCPMARAIKTGTAIDGEEYIIEQPDGQKRNVVLHTFLNLNENGEVTGVTNTLSDITSQKKMQVRAVNAENLLHCKNKELEQFTFMISHVLRAPVARILGLGHILHIDTTDQAFVVRKIAEEAVNLDNALKDINMVLSARNLCNEHWDNVDFDEQLRLAMEALSPEILESNASITADFQQVKGVYTIKNYVYTIILHLLSNAIKFRIPGQPLHIHLETSVCEKFVSLRVKDNGMGIDLDKYSEKVFGLYKRFHEDTIPGKGSGLYLVKTYAESVGGKVRIESKVKAGTQIQVYFPKPQKQHAA